MVHDRRIDGQTRLFGNAGSLFMNALTWYDHETQSIWSQPWRRALQGEHKGPERFLLPSQITTWSSWKIEDQTLSFESRNGELFDVETGSIWDVSRGLVTEGPLIGTSLQQIPSLSSYDWAWIDVYPGSEFYQP